MEREPQSDSIVSRAHDPRRDVVEILADTLLDLLLRFGKDRRSAVRRHLSEGLENESTAHGTKPLIPVSKQAPVFSSGAGESSRNRPGR